MDSLWRALLWKQFGAAIDMLDNAVMACPDSLWRQRLWSGPPPPEFPPQFAEFWYVTYHALVWLDLYLSGVPEEEFAPPAPFAQGELDSLEALPERPYTKEELRAYLAYARQKCRATIETMTDERARQPVSFGWMREGEVVSYAELQLYNMRHVQGHAAELSLLLGQHGVQANQIDWETRAKDDLGGD
jgi:hypothetical protein